MYTDELNAQFAALQAKMDRLNEEYLALVVDHSKGNAFEFAASNWEEMKRYIADKSQLEAKREIYVKLEQMLAKRNQARSILTNLNAVIERSEKLHREMLVFQSTLLNETNSQGPMIAAQKNLPDRAVQELIDKYR
jgi:hypothetical protein